MSTDHAYNIDDPRALKALAHPVRLDLLEAVSLHGPLTATAAADLVGESPANCSWHLRQLAKYGFIEEVPEATGRQRPWRRTSHSITWSESGPDSSYDAAARALTTVFVDREMARIKAAMARPMPDGWADATMANQSIVWLTAAELDDVSERLMDLMTAHRERTTDPSLRPADSMPVRMIALGVPDTELSFPDNPGGSHD